MLDLILIFFALIMWCVAIVGTMSAIFAWLDKRLGQVGERHSFLHRAVTVGVTTALGTFALGSIPAIVYIAVKVFGA